jgi:hypothetical protein
MFPRLKMRMKKLTKKGSIIEIQVKRWLLFLAGPVIPVQAPIMYRFGQMV